MINNRSRSRSRYWTPSLWDAVAHLWTRREAPGGVNNRATQVFQNTVDSSTQTVLANCVRTPSKLNFKLNCASRELEEKEIQDGLTRWINEANQINGENRQLAATLIIECWKNQSDQLNLSNSGLTSIPPEIKALVNLTDLDLSSNHLKFIPPEIKALVNLTHLDLCHNPLKSIPQEIEALVNLIYLDLSDIRLTSIPPEIKTLVNLTHLDLSYNLISSISQEIEALVNLAHLDLSHNRLTSISQEINALVNLTSLDLSYNRISSISQEIEALVNLTYLNLSYNRIFSIPQEIEALVNLAHLDLSHNNLSSIPQEIEALVKLIILNLCHNRLTSIPEIKALVNLTHLYLAYNRLTSISQEINALVNLTHLYLSYNLISSISQEIEALVNLTYLNLCHNRLTSISQEINALVNLTHFDLSYNRLSSLPTTILNLNAECLIDLESNLLSENVRNRLRELMNGADYNGPRILYSMPGRGPDEEDHRNIDELFQEICKTAGEKKPIQLNNTRTDEVRIWLSRLSLMLDYKNNSQKVAQLIYRFIAKAEGDEVYRAAFFNCIHEAAITCGDRVALSVLYLGINYDIANCTLKNDLPKLAYLFGHGSWILKRLGALARQKAEQLPFADPIEVILAYPIKLRKDLNIPIRVEEMLYYVCSELKAFDLKTAQAILAPTLTNIDNYCQMLVKDIAWQSALELHMSDEVDKIKQERSEAFAKVPENDLDNAAVMDPIEENYNDSLQTLTKKILQPYFPFKQNFHLRASCKSLADNCS